MESLIKMYLFSLMSGGRALSGGKSAGTLALTLIGKVPVCDPPNYVTL